MAAAAAQRKHRASTWVVRGQKSSSNLDFLYLVPSELPVSFDPHDRQYRLVNSECAASLSARAHTIFSPTPAAVEAFLAKNPAPTKSSSLYLLSTSIPPSDLSPILVSLQKHLSSSVGSFCTSSPGGPSSLSIVTFPEARTWRSDLSGRPPPEVGRWHRPREETAEDRKGRLEGEGLLAQETHGWDKMWEPDSGSERIPDLDGVEGGTVLVLSDGAPRPVLKALDSMLPKSQKLGLVTAGTPFLTGRPHTLIHNRQIFSSGSVGLVIPSTGRAEVDFAVEPFSPNAKYSVETARGNMLVTLAVGKNPTTVLLAAIRQRRLQGLGVNQKGGKGPGKDEEFYLALLRRNGEEIKELVKILAGDPSRGALSLETENSLVPGQRVRFMRRSKSAAPARPTDGLLTFAALPRSDEVTEAASGDPSVVDGFGREE
ncbi:hypothetical protein EHS25_003002 [Saitozyma podzolica]|uniref:FIST domain-containing protein n=1 Tax=Saitozyma podzolica TaxID=1890683 RepID=A0A427YCU2_9TREE|nr:hypothetical protein EHS25_003002 [Saitozyma podzolica]